MVKFDYAKSRATADRLVAKFGADGTEGTPSAFIRRAGESVGGNPWDPSSQSAEAPTDHPVTVAMVAYDEGDIDGTFIRQGDKQALISVGDLSITPNAGDTLLFGGVAHAIINVSQLNVAGTVVMYQAQVRVA